MRHGLKFLESYLCANRGNASVFGGEHLGAAHPCALRSSSTHFESTLTNRGVARRDARAPSATIIIHTLRINAHKPRGGAQGCARSQLYVASQRAAVDN